MHSGTVVHFCRAFDFFLGSITMTALGILVQSQSPKTMLLIVSKGETR